MHAARQFNAPRPGRVIPADDREPGARVFARRPDAAAADAHPRLSWLIAAVAEDARRARLFRSPREQREMLLMPQPVTTERAYARFGLLLGTLPPAAIFVRLVILFLRLDGGWLLPLLFVPMLIICAFVGERLGGRIGRSTEEYGRGGWAWTISYASLAALGWAIVTGAAGGFLFFGIGAFFGIFCALACALPAFLVFAPLHRALARGGMIDERHLRPLVWGVPANIASLILSPYLLPY
jgi:hypothetical protein